MKEKLTTNLSKVYKRELLQIALSAGLDKVEYGEAIQYLIDEWRKNNGKDQLEVRTK